MIKINPLCEGCRNFSFQATKVGFPCAMHPKGPDKEGCPDFEKNGEAIARSLSLRGDRT